MYGAVTAILPIERTVIPRSLVLRGNCFRKDWQCGMQVRKTGAAVLGVRPLTSGFQSKTEILSSISICKYSLSQTHVSRAN